jgi:sulfur carrier protein ThiS
MKLKVSFFGPIRRPWPETSREVETSSATLEELLSSFGYTPEDRRRVAAVINGSRRPLSAAPVDGDDVRFVLLAGGG